MEPPALPPEVLAALPPEVVALLRWLLDENARLRARVAELEAKLGLNSTNSSKPPSSDPPAVKRAPPKAPFGKPSGGQPGHPKAERALVERPDVVRDCKPEACRKCRRPLAGDDPAPLRHQVTELPPVRPVVTEYRCHRLACPHCRITTCGALPDGVAGQDGPRLQAACALLTGAYRLSKSKAAGLLGDLCGVSISAAQVCATEAAVGKDLQPVADALLEEARRHPANADETSMGRGRWLWVVVTAVATAYRVVAGRNRDELRALLGPNYGRILTSDRHAIYDHLPEDRHQYCWAHLQRDFQAMIDRKDAGSAVGEELLALSGRMFGWWRRVRDGTLTAVRFAGKMHAGRDFRIAFRAAFERGAACGSRRRPGRAGTCSRARRRCSYSRSSAGWSRRTTRPSGRCVTPSSGGSRAAARGVRPARRTWVPSGAWWRRAGSAAGTCGITWPSASPPHAGVKRCRS